MHNKAKRMAAVTGAVAGTALVAAAVMPDVFLKVTTDRQQPRLLRSAQKRMTQRLCASDDLTGVLRAEQKLRSATLSRVSTAAVDGVTLVGHWYPCEAPKRILIAMHGWRSSWARDFGAIADFWHQNGCSVLYAEERGQGSSGGDYLSFGMMEQYDCLSWANYAAKHFDASLPVYLVGISMGATAVLLSTALPLPPTVRGVIADCGFSSPEAIWRHVTQKKLHIPYALLRRRVDGICKKRFGCLPSSASTVEALKKCTLPVLLIHGEADVFVPVEMSREAKAACASECTLLTVPGASHGESYLKATETYQQTISDFWKKHDK